MTLRAVCISILILAALLVGILYVAFGQLTVKKLRKNPATKDILGFEYMSGWDILNVAQAFAFPKSWSQKLESSPLSFFHAKASELHKYTNKFDRLLGFLLYWLLTASGLSCVLLVALNSVGVFQE